jgi:hypothetical protein
VIDDDGWGKETIGLGQEIRWRLVFYEETIKDEELRGVSVFAHGKLAQRPFFFDLGAQGGTEAQAGQQYLSGSVDAGFLDDSTEDLISIERQRVDWEHPASAGLQSWGQGRIRQLLGLWNSRRVEEKMRLIQEKVATFSDRLERLPRHERKIVEGALKNIAQVRALTNEQFVNLGGAVLTAWEGGRLRELIDDLGTAAEMSESDLVTILAEHQVLTALHTAEAVKAKKRVVDGLRQRIHDRELENAVRDYIASDPWLISPRWETFQVERSLKSLLDETAAQEMSEDMLRGRVDLVLSSGDHLLVLEFMRPGLRIDRDHLTRFQFYVRALREAIESNTAGPFKRITGFIVADDIQRDPVIQRTIREMEREDMLAQDWARLLDGASAQWHEFFDILVERVPTDDRLQSLGDDTRADEPDTQVASQESSPTDLPAANEEPAGSEESELG